ncbi:cell division protein FtsL [Paenibacillus septentrionalis]|uniref:Cell division protein FtsL n=1 Tax=Paenibacillus septentrionalis TaxID=429342 RepID=A0ABW1UYQ5_9BACL
MAYHYGNLAVKPKRKQQEEYVIRETRKKVVKRKSIPVGEKLLYLMTVLVCVIVASIIISRYADIYNINLHIKQVNSEMQSMQLDVQQLEREVQTLNDPERIRKYAESQGMYSSLESGIVVKKSDVLEGTARVE